VPRDKRDEIWVRDLRLAVRGRLIGWRRCLASRLLAKRRCSLGVALTRTRKLFPRKSRKIISQNHTPLQQKQAATLLAGFGDSAKEGGSGCVFKRPAQRKG
jgi:hypothetical protein